MVKERRRGRLRLLSLQAQVLEPLPSYFPSQTKGTTPSPHPGTYPPPFPGYHPKFFDQTFPPVPPVASAEGAHSSHSHFLLLALREEQSRWVPWDPHVAHRMRRHLLQEEPRKGVGTQITLSTTLRMFARGQAFAEGFPGHFHCTFYP